LSESSSEHSSTKTKKSTSEDFVDDLNLEDLDLDLLEKIEYDQNEIEKKSSPIFD
jgi:hypothetical protein